MDKVIIPIKMKSNNEMTPILNEFEYRLNMTSDYSSDYHIYRLEWMPNGMQFFVGNLNSNSFFLCEIDSLASLY